MGDGAAAAAADVGEVALDDGEVGVVDDDDGAVWISVFGVVVCKLDVVDCKGLGRFEDEGSCGKLVLGVGKEEVGKEGSRGVIEGKGEGECDGDDTEGSGCIDEGKGEGKMVKMLMMI